MNNNYIMDISRAQEILNYWFPKDGKPDYDKWFMKSEDYDDEIKEKFGDLLKEAEKGKGYGWLVNKDSYLAYIILMDQFSRHIYRGSGDAFKNDNGVMIFTELGFNAYKHELTDYEFMFAFMPYIHSENMLYQKKGTIYFNRYKEDHEDNKILKEMEPHVKGHYMTIKCYRRFPKRNEVLGRHSTFHEQQYMNREEVKKRPY